MKHSSGFKMAAVVVGAFSVMTAHAFDFGADWSYAYTGDSVTFTSNIAGFTGDHTFGTAQFQADRHAGAAGGDTNLIAAAASKVITYCTEIGQYLPTGDHSFEHVSALKGSTAAAVDAPTGAVNFDATRTDRLERLWGTYGPAINDAKSSAAFQLAQWELCFDNDATLKDSSGRIYVKDCSNGTIAAIAENMLTSIRNGSADKKQGLLLLSDSKLQDQITAAPEPGSMAALGLGVAALLKRKRK